MSHLQHQKETSNQTYSAGSRQHVLSDDPATKYIVTWRVEESFRRLMSASKRGGVILIVVCWFFVLVKVWKVAFYATWDLRMSPFLIWRRPVSKRH
jgi:hypothetical protein